MNANMRLVYQRTRQRTLGQIESELQEAQANAKRATRGTFSEEYAEHRVGVLLRERAAHLAGQEKA